MFFNLFIFKYSRNQIKNKSFDASVKSLKSFIISIYTDFKKD